MSLVEDVRPSSRTNPSTWRKIKYSSRSDTPGSCPTSDHRWSATQARLLAPHTRDRYRCTAIPMAGYSTRTAPAQTGLVERPFLGYGHVGCGRRSREAHRRKLRAGASGSTSRVEDVKGVHRARFHVVSDRWPAQSTVAGITMSTRVSGPFTPWRRSLVPTWSSRHEA